MSWTAELAVAQAVLFLPRVVPPELVVAAVLAHALAAVRGWVPRAPGAVRVVAAALAAHAALCMIEDAVTWDAGRFVLTRSGWLPPTPWVLQVWRPELSPPPRTAWAAFAPHSLLVAAAVVTWRLAGPPPEVPERAEPVEPLPMWRLAAAATLFKLAPAVPRLLLPLVPVLMLRVSRRPAPALLLFAGAVALRAAAGPPNVFEPAAWALTGAGGIVLGRACLSGARR